MRHLTIVNAVAMLDRTVGDYVYRVEQPSIALGKTGEAAVITVSTISPWFETLCISADILILHLLTEHNLLPIIEERKREGRPTIYELSDNITALHEGIGIKGWFSDPINLSLAFQYMGMADQFRFVNSRVITFENQMATLGLAGRQASDQITLGWAGSSGHKQDIEAISDVIAQVMHRFTQVNFAYMGDEKIYRTLAATLPPGRVTYTPPGTLEDYLNFLQRLDIGIAPPQDNPYNNLAKAVEYCSRTLATDLSHPEARKLIEEIQKKIAATGYVQ